MESVLSKRFHDRFIVLEGIDGAGKTTQSKMLSKALSDRGMDVLGTRDPGGTKAAEDIRKILLGDNSPESAKTQALLFTAARMDNLEMNILPHLKNDGVVIMDRFLTSTISMQGYGAKFLAGEGSEDPIPFASQMVHLVADLPRHTFLIDLNPEAVKQRVGSREGQALDVFDRKPAAYHSVVREAMLHEAKNFTEILTIIPGHEGPEAIHKMIMEELSDDKAFCLPQASA